MNFSKCSINGKKYGEFGDVLRGNSKSVALGDFPEDKTDKSTEVGLSLSVNNDDDTEETSKEKSSGIMLEPVSVALSSLQQKLLTLLIG